MRPLLLNMLQLAQRVFRGRSAYPLVLFADESLRLYQLVELLVASERNVLFKFNSTISLYCPHIVIAAIAHASAEIRPCVMPARDHLFLLPNVDILFVASFTEAFCVV